MRTRKTFLAKDASGNSCRIVEIQSYSSWNSSNGGGTVATTKELETEDGRPISRIQKGVYEVIDPRGIIRLTSDSPDAS